VGAGAVPVVSDHGLYPAEHRALRELYASTRHLADHWSRLAERLGPGPTTALSAGVAAARGLLRELPSRTARHDVHGTPAAQGVGGNAARVRNLGGDALLERNQALRLAALDAHHVALLLTYLAALAEHRGDDTLAGFHRRWEERFGVVEVGVRTAVQAMAAEPEAAVAPADPSLLGRAGQGLNVLVGTAGEAFDRAARRLRRE